jgi:hypothetical protein
VADAGSPAGWRRIDELAALVGAYCWIERRLFAMAGGWASRRRVDTDGADPASELRVWCAASSRRHGARAASWEERLPVRAGVDAAGFVAAPAGPLAPRLEELAGEPDLPTGVAALVGGVLPALDAVYVAHLGTASPVSEGPVSEVLVEAHREAAAEIRGGRTLVEGLRDGPHGGPTGLAKSRGLFERAFNETHVFPAVRAS